MILLAFLSGFGIKPLPFFDNKFLPRELIQEDVSWFFIHYYDPFGFFEWFWD